MSAKVNWNSMSRFQVIAHIRKRVEKAGSLRQWARDVGLSAPYVSDVLSGRRDPGPKVLTVLKIEKVPQEATRFRHVKRATALRREAQ